MRYAYVLKLEQTLTQWGPSNVENFLFNITMLLISLLFELRKLLFDFSEWAGI